MSVIASTFFGGWGGGGVEEVFLLWGQKQTCLSVLGVFWVFFQPDFLKRATIEHRNSQSYSDSFQIEEFQILNLKRSRHFMILNEVHSFA